MTPNRGDARHVLLPSANRGWSTSMLRFIIELSPRLLALPTSLCLSVSPSGAGVCSRTGVAVQHAPTSLALRSLPWFGLGGAECGLTSRCHALVADAGVSTAA